MATLSTKSPPKVRAKSVAALSKPTVHFAAPQRRLKSEQESQYTRTAQQLHANDDDADSDNSANESDQSAKHAAALIPEVYKKQGSDGAYPICPGYAESTCLCSSTFDDSGLLPPSQRLSYLDRKNWITTERLYELRKKAQDATKHHKTFTIRGCFYSIRKGLIQRGWVEKLDIHRRAPVTGLCQVVPEDLTQHLPMRRPGESRRQHLSKCERNIMSRFLEHIPIDFLWSARKEKTDWIDMARNPAMTINKFHKSPFTTKEGMCTVLRDFHWYFEEGKSEMYYPRSYNVWATDDLSEFIDDFRMSACIAVLRYLCETAAASGIEETANETGTIPISCVVFAMAQCKVYVRSRLHFDIDEDEDRVWDHDWDVFLVHHHMLTQEGAKFKENDQGDSMRVVLTRAERVLAEMALHWTQFNLDGFYNIWIVKPSNRCRGRGIHLMNDMKKILNFVNPPVVNKGHFVVQKYIERPMIIHNCKFDIRQWFLVTSVQPLVIWMYKESYLRFSSQEFSLVNFHESVHLTNHAIQKRYKNGRRDERLPKENMWDCHTFQAYLRQIGKTDMWSERIYPGMQKALIGTMLASQDTMDRRLNTFELYGADFMVSEDCQPWLIEINSSPDLGASTSVTARLCPQCLEDVVKVVIDYRNDPKASTGEFELIYKQLIPPAPAYLGLNLFLKGTQLLPKGAGKKEKSATATQVTKLNTTAKSRDLTMSGGVVNADRPFMMGIFDCLADKATDRVPTGMLRKTARIKSVMVMKKPTNLDLTSVSEIGIKTNKSPKVSQVRTIGSIAAPKTPTDITNRKATKPTDSARRHVSCGPRLAGGASGTTVVQSAREVAVVAAAMNSTSAEDLLQLEIEINNNNNNKDFECVGNKCCVENLPNVATVDTVPEQPLSSNQKTSLESSVARSKAMRSKTSSTYRPTTNGRVNGSSSARRSDKLTAISKKDYQKYVQSNYSLSRVQATPASDNYCSHFFAVGLSLRAWRSKYNKILKTQQDMAHIPISHAYGTHNVAKKGKKPLVKIRKQCESTVLSNLSAGIVSNL